MIRYGQITTIVWIQRKTHSQDGLIIREPKLCPTGDFKVWRQGFDAYITDFMNNQNQNNTMPPLQWSIIGPTRMPGRWDENDIEQTGLGQIHYIAIDPNNINKYWFFVKVSG